MKGGGGPRVWFRNRVLTCVRPWCNPQRPTNIFKRVGGVGWGRLRIHSRSSPAQLPSACGKWTIGLDGTGAHIYDFSYFSICPPLCGEGVLSQAPLPPSLRRERAGAWDGAGSDPREAASTWLNRAPSRSSQSRALMVVCRLGLSPLPQDTSLVSLGASCEPDLMGNSGPEKFLVTH